MWSHSWAQRSTPFRKLIQNKQHPWITNKMFKTFLTMHTQRTSSTARGLIIHPKQIKPCFEVHNGDHSGIIAFILSETCPWNDHIHSLYPNFISPTTLIPWKAASTLEYVRLAKCCQLMEFRNHMPGGPEVDTGACHRPWKDRFTLLMQRVK